MLFFFFFNDTATTEIYTLSLHDALPISRSRTSSSSPTSSSAPRAPAPSKKRTAPSIGTGFGGVSSDRKSTRLNSSHSQISYAVFCLKKKKINQKPKNTHNYAHECSCIAV